MRGRTQLESMRFHSFHGCLEEERRDGRDFLVDVAYLSDISAAALSDDLKDTVDYGKVYDIVARRMSEPSNLLEKVASDLAAQIRAAFPAISSVEVKVSKMDPPVGGEVRSSSVTVTL